MPVKIVLVTMWYLLEVVGIGLCGKGIFQAICNIPKSDPACSVSMAVGALVIALGGTAAVILGKFNFF